MSNSGIILPGLPRPAPNAEVILSELVLLAARAGHEANRAYCKSLGDDSQASWDDAPDWQKQSAYMGASTILASPMVTAELSHIGWMEHKASDGWVYGEEKDPEKKTHPCMVEYSQLTAEHRFKDELFIAVVKAVLSGVLP